MTVSNKQYFIKEVNITAFNRLLDPSSRFIGTRKGDVANWRNSELVISEDLPKVIQLEWEFRMPAFCPAVFAVLFHRKSTVSFPEVPLSVQPKSAGDACVINLEMDYREVNQERGVHTFS